MTDYFHCKNRDMLLEKANRLINDDVATEAMFTDPKDEIFNQPIN